MNTSLETNLIQLSLIPGFEKVYKKQINVFIKPTNEEKDNQLIKEYENLIYYVLKKLGLYSEYGLQEFYDVGMIGLLNGIKTFNPLLNFKYTTYLINCIKNEIINESNKKDNYSIPISSLKTKNELNEEDDIEELDFASNFNLEEEVIKRERTKIIMDYLDNKNYFTSKDRYIFLRLNGFYCEGMSVEELSAELNLDRSTIFKISKKVQNKLEQLVRGL